MFRLAVIAVIAVLLAPSSEGPKAFFGKALLNDTIPSPSPSPSPSAAPGGDPVAAGMVIEQAEDGLFYLDAKVNGQSVRFVVDSGSSVVILNAADAARAGVTARGGVSVDTAGGVAAMHRTRLQTLSLAGQKLSDVDAVIVQRDLRFSLLGQSALTQMRPILFRGNRLEFQ